MESLTSEQRVHVHLTVYADAYHGWDAPRGATFYDPLANGGQGGQVRFFPDNRVAEQSRKAAVEFFRQTFALHPSSVPERSSTHPASVWFWFIRAS